MINLQEINPKHTFQEIGFWNNSLTLPDTMKECSLMFLAFKTHIWDIWVKGLLHLKMKILS